MSGVTGATVVAVVLATAVECVIFGEASVAVALAVAGVAALRILSTIINKIYTRRKVKKKLERVLKEHFTYMEEIERCVQFICSNVDCLKKYDQNTLSCMSMTRLVQVAEGSVRAVGPLSKSSGLIQGFGLGMDIFIRDDSNQLKEDTKTKFANQICTLAKQMQGSLNELTKFRRVLESVDL